MTATQMKYPHIKHFRLDTTNEILTQIVKINDAILLVQSDLRCNIPQRARMRLANAGLARHELEELRRMLDNVIDELVERTKELKKEMI